MGSSLICNLESMINLRESSGRTDESTILSDLGLSIKMIKEAINYTHRTIDSIDEKLTADGGQKITELIELANLSSIIGNLFRTGIVRSSNGSYSANTPHTFPDLLGHKGCTDIEIKVALETNKPKGHLVKSGPHIIVRYVLADSNGYFSKDKRGNTPWIWEVRIGHLKDEHFNTSNTQGDSGKTAVVNSAGMKALSVVYFDDNRCPLSKPSLPAN